MAAKPTPKEAARTFDFTPTYSVSIPENMPTQQRASELPFRDYFNGIEGAAKEGKQPHLFLPHTFWTTPKDKGGRGVEAMKPTPDGYAKQKVREQFNKWKEQPGTERDKLTLVLLGRSGSEGIDGITEPGISIWVTNPK